MTPEEILLWGNAAPFFNRCRFGREIASRRC